MTVLIRSSLAAMCGLFVFGVCVAQQPNASARAMLRQNRPLSASEIAQVLDAVYMAMKGQTFRMAALPNGAGPKWQVQMDDRGGPRYLRTDQRPVLVSFDDYTGRTAKTCSGKPLAEELVITYGLIGADTQWTATARIRSDYEAIPDYSAIFRLQPESGAVAQIEGREARAFVAPWKVRSGDSAEIMAQVRQTLWIDVESLLPIRWEMTREGTPTGYGLTFTPDPSIRLGPPEGVAALECVPDR